MRLFAALILTTIFSFTALGQAAQPVIEAEKAFAERAAASDSRTAFLEFASGDAILFLPDRIRAAEYWQPRAADKAALVWAPNFADISASARLGYTTGNWEYRPDGKTAVPAAFGQFVTIWQQQPDGKFKYSLDIGISHARPERFSDQVATPQGSAAVTPSVPAVHVANRFFETAGTLGTRAAYKAFLADDARGLREGQLPILGRKAFLDKALEGVRKVEFRKRSVFVEAGDLAYVTNTYTLTKRDGTAENGNFLQIWKYRDGEWRIVLDIFKPVPAK